MTEFLNSLGRYLRPYRRRIGGLFLLLLLETGFASSIPVSFKFLIDQAVLQKNMQALLLILVLLGAGVVLVTSTGLYRDRLTSQLTSRIIGDVRERLFAHLQSLSMEFFGRTQVGDVLARFSTDLASFEGALTSAIPWGVLPSLDVLMSTALLFWLDWRLALLALLVFPVSLAGPRVFGPKASAAGYLRKQAESETLSVVQENLLGQAVIKAFGLERRAMESFARRNVALIERSAQVGFFGALIERSSAAATQTLYVLVLGTGAYMTFRGWLSVGSLAAFQALFLSLSYSLNYVTQYAPNVLQAAVSIERMEEILREQPRVDERANAIAAPPQTGQIRFEDVSFGYSPEHLNLTNLNLEIRNGESVAFVGSSGSGKSTVLNMILRTYDPASGRVLLGEAGDFRDYRLESLRARYGVVFQENFLFNTSVRENIRLGRPAATDAEVEAAARAAEIHDFVAGLPEGYETSAGERGGHFSGGQRQRIALARALLRNPAVLVLDEATSALDPATETALNATLQRVARGRTLVSVTHRLHTVTSMDRIFVMDHGRLAESGTHAELLEARGLYKQHWDKQSGFTLSAQGDTARVDAAKLRTFPILQDIDDAILAELTGLFATERIAAKRSVIQEGDAGDKFYIIVRGKVEVVKSERPMGVLSDGDYFGEIALLRDVPRAASVRTMTECVFLTLSRARFDHLLDEAPHLRAHLSVRYAD